MAGLPARQITMRSISSTGRPPTWAAPCGDGTQITMRPTSSLDHGQYDPRRQRPPRQPLPRAVHAPKQRFSHGLEHGGREVRRRGPRPPAAGPGRHAAPLRPGPRPSAGSACRPSWLGRPSGSTSSAADDGSPVVDRPGGPPHPTLVGGGGGQTRRPPPPAQHPSDRLADKSDPGSALSSPTALADGAPDVPGARQRGFDCRERTWRCLPVGAEAIGGSPAGETVRIGATTRADAARGR